MLQKQTCCSSSFAKMEKDDAALGAATWHMLHVQSRLQHEDRCWSIFDVMIMPIVSGNQGSFATGHLGLWGSLAAELLAVLQRAEICCFAALLSKATVQLCQAEARQVLPSLSFFSSFFVVWQWNCGYDLHNWTIYACIPCLEHPRCRISDVESCQTSVKANREYD